MRIDEDDARSWKKSSAVVWQGPRKDDEDDFTTEASGLGGEIQILQLLLVEQCHRSGNLSRSRKRLVPQHRNQ